MALRAGYYGLKNSVKRSLEKMAVDISGMKIIKTIGNGLKLTNNGSLSVDVLSDSLEFKSGKLVVKNSLDPENFVSSGQAWINGNYIEEKLLKLNISGLEEADISSSAIKGHVYLDFGYDDYDAIWIDTSKSFLYCPHRIAAPLSTPIVYPVGLTYVRANIQQRTAFNNGNVSIYVEITYNPDSFNNVYDNFIILSVKRVLKTT